MAQNSRSGERPVPSPLPVDLKLSQRRAAIAAAPPRANMGDPADLQRAPNTSQGDSVCWTATVGSIFESQCDAFNPRNNCVSPVLMFTLVYRRVYRLTAK